MARRRRKKQLGSAVCEVVVPDFGKRTKTTKAWSVLPGGRVQTSWGQEISDAGAVPANVRAAMARCRSK